MSNAGDEPPIGQPNGEVRRQVSGTSEQAGTVFCTNCGRATEPGEHFCANCGHQLLDGNQAQPTQKFAQAPPNPDPGSMADAGSPEAASRPAWLIPAVIGFGVVAVIVAVVLVAVFAFGGGSSQSADATKYNAAIQGPMTELNNATISISNGLASAGTAADVNNVKTLAKQGLTSVSHAQSELTAVQAPTSRQSAQTALLAAAAAERHYLSLLVRATSQPPATAQKSIAGLVSQATTVTDNYNKFFALASGVQNVITTANLGNFSGLNAAFSAAAQQQTTANNKANSSPGISVVGSGNGSSNGFISPAQTTQCETAGSAVICQSAAGTVAIAQSGAASQIGSVNMGSGFDTLVYGRTWSYGAITCSIDYTVGTVCVNSTGDGFQIRKQDLSTY